MIQFVPSETWSYLGVLTELTDVARHDYRYYISQGMTNVQIQKSKRIFREVLSDKSEPWFQLFSSVHCSYTMCRHQSVQHKGTKDETQKNSIFK